MRIIVDNNFTLEDLNQADIDFLKACTIFHSLGEQIGHVIITEQKIDLYYDHMEAFLDIVAWGGNGLITLERYGSGRYGLKLK